MPRLRREQLHGSSCTDRQLCPRCRKSFKAIGDVIRHMNQALQCKKYIYRLFHSQTRRPRGNGEANDENVEPNNSYGEYNNEDGLGGWEGDGHNGLDAEDSHNHDTLLNNGSTPDQPYKEYYPEAAKAFGRGPTFMDTFEQDIYSEQRRENIFYPFASKQEWEIASFLLRSKLSMAAIEEFLSLESIRGLQLSFQTAKDLRSRSELLPPGPRWKCKPWITKCETADPVLLHYRNPLECLQSIFSNPLLQDHIQLVPYQMYKTAQKLVRVFGEWMSGNAAWSMQNCLPTGSTLLGVVASSDKTTISAMTGDRTAYPLIISLANLDMSFRMKGTHHAFLLTALLPVAKFIHKDTRMRSLQQDRLIHECLTFVFEPLKKAAEVGVFLTDPLGCRRFCFTPLASYIADTPEQQLLACVSAKTSPATMATVKEFGDSFRHVPRTSESTLATIKDLGELYDPVEDIEIYLRESVVKRLNAVPHPFWENWRLSQPYIFLTPEMLHHWHRFSWDHDAKWCIKAVGAAEIDFRFSVLAPRTGLRHFKAGISGLKQVTGRAQRDIQRHLIAVISQAENINVGFALALRGLMDFRYFAQARSFSEEDCDNIAQSLNLFHCFKQSILDCKARVGKKNNPMNHFNIQKLELLQSVVPSIFMNGAPLQWSADVTEFCHIGLVKAPARLGNNQNYIPQICRALDRQDNIRRFELATAMQLAKVRFGFPSEDDPFGDDDDNDDDDDDDEVYDGRAPPNRTTITSSSLLSEIQKVSNAISGPRIPRDLFREAGRLQRGEERDAPVPHRTFAVSSTAFHLSRDPGLTNMTVDSAAVQFNLPDLRPALSDYLSRASSNNASIFPVGGRRTSRPECGLPFDKIQVWCKLRMQNRSYHYPHNILPAQTLNIFPPSDKWPLGRYDSVLLNTDPAYEWPSSGLDGHIVVEIRLIMRAILPRGVTQIAGLDSFIAYVQRLDFTADNRPGFSKRMDITTGLFPLKRACRSDNSPVGDIVPVSQFRTFVDLVPRFGNKADSRFTKQNSIEYSKEVWLNPYFDKETFYSLRSHVYTI